MPILLTNKKARFEYHILESYQAGLSLSGPMVKLIRAKKCKLDGVYIILQRGRLELIDFGNEHLRENIPLLLKKKEIDEIRGHLAIKGITCIPINIKTIGRWIKAEIAVVRGKKIHDKRNTIKKRDLDRDQERNLVDSYKNR